MNEAKGNFDIAYYVGIVKRRKWFFITPLIIVYIAFLASSFLLPKVYEAKAIMLVEEKKIVNPLLKNLAVSTTVADRLNSLSEEILAWPRLFQLVERLELNKNVDDPLSLERLINDIRKNIHLRMKSREVVVISYQSEDPKSTQELVNTLCDILIKRNLSLQTEDTQSAIDFISEQIKIYQAKLDESAKSLRQFQEIYGMGTLSEATTQAPLGQDAVVAGDISPAGITLLQINQEIAGLEADLVMASVDCTDEHPRVRELKRRIESLKEKRLVYIREAAEKTGVDAERYIDIVDSVPRQQEELNRLTRDNANNEKTYKMLLERLETARITEDLDNSENRTKFRIIEPARLPLVASKPNKAKFNLFGLLLGSMVGFGFVYLLEYTDSSFKTSEQLKETFGYPVLGNISKIMTEDDLIKKRDVTSRIAFVIGLLTLALIIALIVFIKKDAIVTGLWHIFSKGFSLFSGGS